MSGKNVYELAAKQALADIPAKQAEISDLVRRLDAARQELSQLRSIAAYGKPSGELTEQLVPLAIPDESTPPKSSYIKLHEIFDAADKLLSISEIQQQVAKRYGEPLPNSTLHVALNKGMRKQTFIQEDGKYGHPGKGQRVTRN